MNKYLALKLYLSVIIVFLIAISNSYLVNLKGAEVDAERFLEHANNWAFLGTLKYAIDAEFFIQFLGVFVYLFSFDEFQLTLIGLFAYYAIYFKLFLIVDYKSAKIPWAFHIVVVLALFSPSVLLRVGALLREPYVIVALGFMVYFGVRYIETLNVKFIFYSLMFGFFGMFFHKAILAFIPIYFILILFFNTSFNIKSILFGLVILGVSSIVMLVVFPSLSNLRGGAALSVVLTGEFSGAEQVVGYKSGREFRTTYDYGADFSNIFTIMLTALKANYYYYFSPFPWNIRTFSDIYAFIENSLRFFVIGFISLSLFKKFSKPVLFVFLCYLLLNTIWAVGTSNYGTGSRHHITTLPLLMLALIYILKNE